ncbi:endolytic transglycosylase MltG [Neptunomonas sp. XY-337]|uniref:endolytic transglycosylase MltG n=1 Tax=Neptunomonas sp. XY-337 TaxID=2561897 RepID=UPI001F10C999|nr:endolytic transglycosylase MltG [Neptunomonas sp. XY-337]
MKRFFSVLFLMAIAAGATGYWLWGDLHRYMSTSVALEAPVESLVVEKGTSFNRLLNQLEKASLIDNPLYFKVYARLNKLAHRVKAGEYQFASDVTPAELLDKMVRGETVQHYFTIIEGTTFRQLRSALAAKAPLLKTTIADMSDQEVLKAIGAKEQHPEGLFLAETYQIKRDSTDLELLKRSYQQLQTALQASWDSKEKSLPYKSSYEALIMASIVEKETAVAAERPQIAGVFVKRLRKGMRLQTDPTVIYGMGERYKGNITRKDLRRPTPYNTYTIPALPPTPIAMVGREAIQAALNPVVGKWLYFVAKGDGTHQFSATLRDHNNAVRQYQLRRKREYRSTPE